MEAFNITFKKQYNYNFNTPHCFQLNLTVYLPCTSEKYSKLYSDLHISEDTLLHPLLVSIYSKEVVDRILTKHWGVYDELRCMRYWTMNLVSNISWEDVDRKSKVVIEETLNTLTEVVKINLKRIEEKPENEEKEVSLVVLCD